MAQRKHISLTASTAASVTLTALSDLEKEAINDYAEETHRINRSIRGVLILNRSEDDEVFYRFDGINPTETGADDDWVLPPRASYLHEGMSRESMTVVLISPGTPNVSLSVLS